LEKSGVVGMVCWWTQ